MSNQFEGKSIAVIGANGYLGSALVQALYEKDCQVVRVSSKKLNTIPNIIDLNGSIQDLDFCNQIIKQSEVIYLLSGNTSLRVAEKNPLYNLSTTITPIENIIQSAIMNNKLPRLIFASTATVYGLTPKKNVDEKYLTKPETIYDLHKLFGEQLISYASKKGIIEGVSLRLSNVYGPSLIPSSTFERGVINRAVMDSVKGKNLMLFGNGEYLRDYIYISDVINSLIISGFSAGVSGEVFNIGTGIGNSIERVYKIIAKTVEKQVNKKISITYSEWPLESHIIEQRNFIANIDKFKKCTGWTPQVDVDQGISSLVSSAITQKL